VAKIKGFTVPGSEIYYPVPSLGNKYPVFHHDHTKYYPFGLYFHLLIKFRQYCTALSTTKPNSFDYLFNFQLAAQLVTSQLPAVQVSKSFQCC